MRHSLPISPQILSTPGCLDENAARFPQQQRQQQREEQPVCAMLKRAHLHQALPMSAGEMGATQAPCLLHISRATPDLAEGHGGARHGRTLSNLHHLLAVWHLVCNPFLAIHHPSGAYKGDVESSQEWMVS